MIEIYDSTLRDGGYINNWRFPKEKAQMIYDASNDAGIDYVEIGYIGKIDPTCIEKKQAKIMVMVDYNKREKYDLSNLKNIDGIRVAVHKENIYESLSYIKEFNVL